MHITIVTIGSRGDVQPFIAFALGLQRAGHHVRIATHGTRSTHTHVLSLSLCDNIYRIAECFRDFVTGYGIEFFPLGGDPKELMQLCVKNDMFTVKFVQEGLANVGLYPILSLIKKKKKIPFIQIIKYTSSVFLHQAVCVAAHFTVTIIAISGCLAIIP
jgi:hypothetical protein